MRAAVAEALIAEAIINSGRVSRVYTLPGDNGRLGVVFEDGTEYTITIERDEGE